MYVVKFGQTVAQSSSKNGRGRAIAQWVPNGLNRPKISSLDVISRVFLVKFQQIHITFFSGHLMRFILFKIRQTVAGISLIRQFHEFSNSADSHNFRFRSFDALHIIQNSSNCCRHQFDPSISRIF